MSFAKRWEAGGRVLVEPIDAIRWRMHEMVAYHGEKQTFIIPAGYITDFATIPRIAVWLIARFGVYTPAAILHDWLLTELVAKGLMSSIDADNIFRRALRELDVPPYRRNLMWTGVRWAALFSKYRRAEWWRTFPEMMGWTLVFLASIVPPLAMLVVGVAIFCHSGVETIVSALSPKDKTSSGSLST